MPRARRRPIPTSARSSSAAPAPLMSSFGPPPGPGPPADADISPDRTRPTAPARSTQAPPPCPRTTFPSRRRGNFHKRNFIGQQQRDEPRPPQSAALVEAGSERQAGQCFPSLGARWERGCLAELEGVEVAAGDVLRAEGGEEEEALPPGSEQDRPRSEEPPTSPPARPPPTLARSLKPSWASAPTKARTSGKRLATSATSRVPLPGRKADGAVLRAEAGCSPAPPPPEAGGPPRAARPRAFGRCVPEQGSSGGRESTEHMGSAEAKRAPRTMP